MAETNNSSLIQGEDPTDEQAGSGTALQHAGDSGSPGPLPQLVGGNEEVSNDIDVMGEQPA